MPDRKGRTEGGDREALLTFFSLCFPYLICKFCGKKGAVTILYDAVSSCY